MSFDSRNTGQQKVYCKSTHFNVKRISMKLTLNIHTCVRFFYVELLTFLCRLYRMINISLQQVVTVIHVVKNTY